MNAQRLQFPILGRAGLLVGAVSCLLLAGCIGDPFKEAKVDPNSAVAADVTKMTTAKASFPTFRDIPAASKDNRPIAAYGQSAKQLEVAAAQIVQATDPGTWTLQNSEAFAEDARKSVGPELPPPNPADTEAYIKSLRERATPPPQRPRR